MRAFVSLVLVMAIAFGIYYGYVRRVQPAGGGGGSAQAIVTTGVQNDLLRIAQAERMYFAEHGNYADLDTLITSGALSMTRPERDGYTYRVNVSTEGFTVTARRPGADYPGYAIDQTMRIRPVQ
jgi:hypothetical protein